MPRCLLDTNICMAQNRPESAHRRLAQCHSSEAGIGAITLAELERGALKRGKHSRAGQ